MHKLFETFTQVLEDLFVVVTKHTWFTYFCFIDSIIDNSKKPLVSEEETYNLMSVCFSAEEAMKTGRKVKVRYY